MTLTKPIRGTWIQSKPKRSTIFAHYAKRKSWLAEHEINLEGRTMADYFTSDHFKLLNKWKRHKRGKSNPEQNRAYEDLKKAYEVTEAWAQAVQKKIFPHGTIEVRKRPTNQGNNFASYNWAKIYPLSEAPKELAYTVGIDSDDGFVVKIDTVGLKITALCATCI